MKRACIHIAIRFAHKIILGLLFILYSITGTTQAIFPEPDYSKVDRFVLTIKYENDYIKLAKDLAAPFPEDIYKARAIFKWICNNISYDYRFINKEKEIQVPECSDRYDCADIIRSWENDYIKRILRTRKAIADGYARLFKTLCEIVHIQTEILAGYSRSKPYQIGNRMSVNHCWNAFLIDTAWYFADPTLAAGYCTENEETGKLVKYVPHFENYYWLTSFERLARNHFPKNAYWGQQYHTSYDDFISKPHYYSVEILENMSNETPAEGILTIKKNDTIHFCFEYQKDIRYIQVNSNTYRNPSLWTTVTVSKRKTKLVRDTWAEKKQVYLSFQKTGNTYSFDYVVKDMSLYYIELALDYKKAMRYKVTVLK